MRYAHTLASACLVLLSLAASALPAAPQAPAQGSRSPSEAAPPALPAGGLLLSGQSPLLGGVPRGRATSAVLPLSLADAITRGLAANLGIVLGEQAERAAAGSRWQALSGVLPNALVRVGQSRQEINLEEFGFPLPAGQSPIVGPFNVAAIHLDVAQPLFDYAAIQSARAGILAARAAGHSFNDVRDLVVFMTSNLYLQAVTAASRIEAARAQVNTAQALYDRAVDMKRAGVVAGIEVLRAQVQLQAQQQRLIVDENDFAKAKLTLQRAVGIPLGQQVELTDSVPYAPLDAQSLEALEEQAYASREDLRAAVTLLDAARANRQAALGTALPTVRLQADLGRSSNAWDTLKGTYSLGAAVTVPLFQGGRARGRVVQAEAQLRQQEAQVEDLRARIDYEVRSALLDVKAADDRLRVAQNAVELARQQLVQAEDRFSAGVASNIEVVQAQEAQATASENALAALHAHNLAKISLARAVGLSEERAGRFLAAK